MLQGRRARQVAWGSGGSSKKKPEETKNPSGEKKDSQTNSQSSRHNPPPVKTSQNKPRKRSASPPALRMLPRPDYNYAVHDEDEEDTKIKNKMAKIEVKLDKHQEIYDRKLESYAVAYTVGHDLHRVPGLTGRHVVDLHKLSKPKLKHAAEDWAKMIENELKNDILNDMKELRECYKGLKNNKHIPLLSEWKRGASDEKELCEKEEKNLQTLAEKLVNIPEGDEHEREKVKMEQRESFIKLAGHEYRASEYRRKRRYVIGESEKYEIPVHKFFTPKKA